MVRIKEVHSSLRGQFESLEFLNELKGLEQAYTAVHTRIKHIKKRFKVFDFFERLRVGIFKNHNSLIWSVTDEVLEAVERSKALVSEFNAHFAKLHEIVEEVGLA